MFNNGWFVRLILVLWLVSAVFIMFSLGRIDWIVHHELYNFGLQFSDDWALTYWAFLRMTYVFLALPFVVSVAYFVLDVWRFINLKRKNVVKAETSEPVNVLSMLNL